jgi:nifR3 family TIM-barrel protein
VFRSLCIEEGADFTFTELISSQALIRDSRASDVLIRRAANEVNYGIQLFGSDPDVMGRAAEFVLRYKPAVIDINAGCPVNKVTKTGAGAALMRNPLNLGRIVDAVAKAGVPVTVKMRSGCDSINFKECADIAVDNGAAMITLHPRTRAQGYEGKCKMEYIGELAGRLKVPVTGSGDLYTPEDAQKMLSLTGSAAVMFARGAMGNPFIFSAARKFLLNGEDTIVDIEKRIETAFRHLELLVLDVGEKRACLEMRKIFCAYIKGAPGAASLRNSLVHASSVKEYSEIIAEKTGAHLL